MLSYPDIMYQCIELMDRANERHIDEVVLASTIREYIKPLDQVEEQRLLSAYQTENLLASNIISDIDKRDGSRYLLFQEAILTLFRLCEMHLYQEVTDAKLRSKLVSLWDARERLESSTFIESDLDYTELTEDIMEQLSELLTMLRNNIIAMQRIGEKLEDLTAEASKSPNEFSKYRQTMFENTVRLFDRHIKPTLNFLDPSSRLVDGTNLLNTLAEIRQKYVRNQKYQIADQIFRFSMSFENIFKPIQKVERQVDNFLRKTRIGMLQYNAMESSYQELKKIYADTQSNNLKHRFMTSKEFCNSTNYILGLKQHSRPQTYQFGESASYFENIFSEISLRLSSLNLSEPSLFEGENYRNDQGSDRLQRAELLYNWLSEQPFRPTKDMIAMLHYRLEGWLNGYCFPDLLTAIIRLKNKKDWEYEVVSTNIFSYVSIDNQAFVYRQRLLVKVGS